MGGVETRLNGPKAERRRAFGKPDAGKPPVRFDEGRSATVTGPRASQPVRSAFSAEPSPFSRTGVGLGEHFIARNWVPEVRKHGAKVEFEIVKGS